MMRFKMPFVFLFFVAMFLVSFLAHAQSLSPQETLNQYVAELQKNPDDNMLREKIIKLAQEMKPALAIPAEAEKFGNRAEFAANAAKTEADFADAAKEYEKALLIAPWVADYYNNLGVMQEKSNQPQKAANNFTLYLAAEPNSKDARAIRKHIDGLEYAAEKTAKESSPEVVAAKTQDAYGEWLKGIDGARFLGAPTPWGAIGHENDPTYVVYYINGHEVSLGRFYGDPPSFRTSPISKMEFNDGQWTEQIQGKQFRVPVPSFLNDQRPCMATISDDGQFLTEQCPGSGIPIAYTRVK